MTEKIFLDIYVYNCSENFSKFLLEVIIVSNFLFSIELFDVILIFCTSSTLIYMARFLYFRSKFLKLEKNPKTTEEEKNFLSEKLFEIRNNLIFLFFVTFLFFFVISDLKMNDKHFDNNIPRIKLEK